MPCRFSLRLVLWSIFVGLFGVTLPPSVASWSMAGSQETALEDASDGAESPVVEGAADPDKPADTELATAPALDLKNFQWRGVGPTATGGRIIDIAVDPDNEHHILVASAAGGLWETTNNGTTWSNIFSAEGSISIGDVAFDPAQPTTIWIGTGEANNQRSSIQGDGVYKSTDGGKSWKNMGLKDTRHIGRIVVDPNDSNTVYVAAVGHLYTENEERGLYKTTDGGETWTKCLYVSPTAGVIDVMVHPKNSKIVVAASYERIRRAWNLVEAGPDSAIHRSEDGGQTWVRLGGGLPDGQIGRIGLAYFYDNPDVMYATVANFNPRPVGERTGRRGDDSVSDEHESTESEEIEAAGIDSEEEGAASPGGPESLWQWQDEDATGSDPQDSDDTLATPFGFALKASDSGFEVATVRGNSPAAQAGVREGDRLVSVGGNAHWTETTLREFLTGIQAGDKIQWVFSRDGNDFPVNLSLQRTPRSQEIGGEIYRSEDAGLTWKKMNRQPVGGNPPYYYGQIAVDPYDDQRIYVLSVPVYVSDDGGVTFRQDGAPSVHVDHHAIWVNPFNHNHVMLGNDGGFHISYDRCQTWDYVFNIPLAQFYAITADQQRPYHVYGGLQDNGSWGGPSDGAGGVTRDQWYRVGGGDGFYVQVDPTDNDLVYAESQFGVLFRLRKSTGERKSIRPPQSDPNGPRDRYNWNSPILLSTHDPRTLYFGGNKLFMSYNQGDEWLTISPDLTTADPAKLTGNVPHCTITTIAESPLDRNWLMVGTDDGLVHITRDRGETWENISTGFPTQPESWWCSRVEFSHADKQTAFVSFTGYREDDFRPFLFKTTDAGKTWTAINGNLPNECINVVKQDPRRANTLYVGTDLGCYVSLNGGEHWHRLNGFGNAPVHDLLVHTRERDLIIGTHGRGIYIMDDITPFQETSDELDALPGHLFSIRDWEQYRLPEGSSFAGDRKVTVPNSPSGVILWYQIGEAGKDAEIKLTIEDLDGKTVAELDTANESGWHRATFPAGASGRGGRGGRGRGRGNAGSAGPGTYRAILKVGEHSSTQTFEIKRVN